MGNSLSPLQDRSQSQAGDGLRPVIDNTALLKVAGLRKSYPLPRTGWGVLLLRPIRMVRACDGVDLTIGHEETLGLVGESGSGKSTVGRCILLLDPPDSGSIEFNGRNLQTLSSPDLRQVRREMQVIFQDPLSSLNPRVTVGETVVHPLRTHGLVHNSRDAVAAACDLLRLVGLPPEAAGRYPHELSGGQCQRVCIARAVALRPKFIVADEPVSALDVSVQAQILNLIKRLQIDLGVAYLFISHDLRVVRHISRDVAVMYAGQIVESGPTREIFSKPHHPYTRALLASVPRPQPRTRGQTVLQGEPLNPVNLPPGCRFAPRCGFAKPQCSETQPALRHIGPGEHMTRCILE